MPHDRFLREFEPVKNSPQFDNVVTAENCYYYMSLLESFYEVEKSMSPELFKRYIVAAEKRYLEFMQNYSTFGLYDPLPLDIAYAWHAHMLSPFRYYDDLNSNYNYGSIKLSIGRQFPLKAMHLQRRKKSLGLKDNDKDRCRRLGICPWDLDIDELRHATFEDEAKRFNPYYLPSGENVPAYIQRRFGMYIRCASCGTDLFFESWEQYELFRMDPNIAFHCPAPVCRGDTTVDSSAVSELLASLPHKIKGTRLKSNGTWKEPNRNEEAIRERLGYIIESRKKSIRCIKDVCDLLTNPNLKFDVPGKPPLTVEELRLHGAYAKEFAGIIRSTYESNPTCLSLDLVQAIHRQREFIHTMVTKIAPKWSENPLELEIPNAIRDYHDFLLLIKSQQVSTTILPTWSVDMVWHVHMLHFSKFRELTMRDLGRMLNHDNNIVPFQLNEHYLATEKAWDNVPSSLVSLNLGRITKQGIHDMRPSLVNSAHVYRELESTMINHYTRRKMRKSGVSFTKPQDLSYHGIDFADLLFQQSRKSAELSKKYSLIAYLEILKAIEYTGYGYIGTIIGEGKLKLSKRVSKAYEQIKIVPQAEKNHKRIETVVYPSRAPVPRLDLRRVGRIKPGAEIIRAPKTDLKSLYCGRNFLGEKHKIGAHRWWKPKGNYYGLMRRSFSKKHNQWGWTTDGLDWYSETECNFVSSPRGRFFGEVHRQPRRLLGSLNSGRSGSVEYNDADYDDGDFSGGDDDSADVPDDITDDSIIRKGGDSGTFSNTQYIRSKEKLQQ